MDIAQYRCAVERIPYGKRLPTSLYVYRSDTSDFGMELNALLAHLAAQFQIGPEFNLLKLRWDELKISFLAYPDFFDVAHPPLRYSVTIDLASAKVRRTDYSKNSNPPILHRKETFLPLDHTRRAEFERLTRAEESAGLYEETATIGFRLNWEKRLAAKGLVIRGHSLESASGQAERGTDSVTGDQIEAGPVVDRHKTALTRYELSKPVKTLLEYGLLKSGTTFFDYGCGQGSDVRGLQALGHNAEGWDPVHFTDRPKRQADIVNLGYVLNVIEDPAERVEALVDAYRHAHKLLVVAGLINETVDTARARVFSDGVLTRANTFQKFFEQQELQQYIEDALDSTAIPVALGVFYVFRDPADQQDFLSARSRRAIDWGQISARLGLGSPRTLWKALYETHNSTVNFWEAFWSLALQLGRLPESEEFPQNAELREKVGSPKQALRLFFQKGGGDEFKAAAEARKRDLLVYVALANLRKRVPFGHLSQALRWDIREFFGNYTRALEKGLELLYTAGDPGEIELACADLKLGWQDEQALYLHRSLLNDLPAVLRAYVGCATALFGDVAQADVIKLHKASGKVTFLVYDDFEGKPLPELRQRIKVNLRTRWVQVFDHSAEGQLLYFKERFVSAKHPDRDVMESFSAKLRKLGFDPATIGRGLLRPELDALFTARGLNENLNPRRRLKRQATPTR